MCSLADRCRPAGFIEGGAIVIFVLFRYYLFFEKMFEYEFCESTRSVYFDFVIDNGVVGS